MDFGQKLKTLRTNKGLTQKSLADQLNVTFQTVSKWEKGENEPDFATLKEIAHILDCSIDFLLDESLEMEQPSEQGSPQEPNEESEPAPQPQTTIIIHEHELHTCPRCNKPIPEEELRVVQIPHHTRAGRLTHTTYSQAYYHNQCWEDKVAEDKALEEKRKALLTSRRRAKCFGWSIAAGVVSLAVSLLVLLLGSQDVLQPALAVLASIGISYGFFAALYCILSGSYIADVFTKTATWTIKFPGIIFTFDLGGLKFLILMKLLFAVLGFLFGVFVFVLAVALSVALSVVSFPFVLIHNIHNGYDDSLFD